MNRQTLTLAAAVCCGLCLYLIGGESQQQIAATPESNTVGEKSSDTASPEILNTADKPVAEKLTTEQETNDEALKVAFEPPFPDRVHLFQAPKREGRGRTKSNNQSESSLELVGFVNVFEPQVSLSIDGMVTMIAEGGVENGVKVISIQPPTVLLQRGRQREQLSLAN